MSNIDNLIIIRGGGDLATGVVQKFYRAGLPVLILETEKPTAIRRSVALCEAAIGGFMQVEDVPCRKINGLRELFECISAGEVALHIDPQGKSISSACPRVVIDAIMAKRNLGMCKGLAEVTIALGPGFCAGKDVHAVIETVRGHDLGRLILDGYAKADTGVPGLIDGKSAERVIRAPCDGFVVCHKEIGDTIAQGEVILSVDNEAVRAPFSGLLRGLIREGLFVHSGMKIADIDPRTDIDCKSISDKARCIGGAALEAFFLLRTKKC